MTRFGLLAGGAIALLVPLSATAADDHVVAQPDTLKWGAGPLALPKGAQMAVILGDSTKEGPYVYRMKLPAGYKVPAHTHPVDENVTVISGSFNMGVGDKLDETKGNALKSGGFSHVPKGTHHYAWFPEETVIQVHGVGPSGITYVNPADDPRKTN